MLGAMSERPLLISSILTHSSTYHGDTEIVSQTIEGAVHRYTYAEAERRSKRLARALLGFGIEPGDRVGTLAWNTFRHFELYYGTSGIGAVCHTINPRLFDDQATCPDAQRDGDRSVVLRQRRHAHGAENACHDAGPRVAEKILRGSRKQGCIDAGK